MTVKAKFRCWNKYDDGRGMIHVQMLPVYGDGTDNAQWSKATPSGMLQMAITNPDASDEFEVGAEYILTFEKVEKPSPVANFMDMSGATSEAYNEQAA